MPIVFGWGCCFYARDAGIDLTLKLQTTKPSGTIQTRKTVDLGIAPTSIERRQIFTHIFEKL